MLRGGVAPTGTEGAISVSPRSYGARMCVVCERAEPPPFPGNLGSTFGGVAQLVERLHGMQEVSWVRFPSPPLSVVAVLQSVAAFLGGYAAGEGCFSTRRSGQFVFSVKVAQWDTPVLEAFHHLLGAGSLHRHQPRHTRWQPQVSLEVTGRRQHVESVIPFMDRWLPRASAKWHQFEAWRELLLDDVRVRPFRTPGVCSEDGCNRPIRGRGLCRSHYYRATGY
jgi:hypothetical protein